MSLPTQLTDFEGVWSIWRRIEDTLGAQSGTFQGSANIAPDGENHVYGERGTLTLETGATFTSERRYIWRAAGPGRISAFFDDGRAFHEIALDGRTDATHLCPPDTYRVSYDFAAWPIWRATWQVTGPRKDYRMTATYQRA